MQMNRADRKYAAVAVPLRWPSCRAACSGRARGVYRYLLRRVLLPAGANALVTDGPGITRVRFF
jgi:hypothetical protein